MKYKKGKWDTTELEFLYEYYESHGGEYVANKLNRKVQSVYDKASQENIQGTKLKNRFSYSRGNLDIAYLLGIYLTDGCAGKYGWDYQFAINNTDISILHRINECMRNFFDRTYPVYHCTPSTLPVIDGVQVKSAKDFYRMKVTSRELVEFLIDTTQNKKVLPDFVFKESRQWQMEFLAGIMDGDGFLSSFIDKRNGIHRITGGFVGVEGYYIEQMPRLLDKMKIHYTISTRVSKNPNKRTLKLIYFNESTLKDTEFIFYCDRKRHKLEKFMTEKYFSECSETRR